MVASLIIAPQKGRRRALHSRRNGVPRPKTRVGHERARPHRFVEATCFGGANQAARRLSADVFPVFRSGTTSKSTFCPSASLVIPARSTALICTKTSLLPSSGWMKPNPFSPLNHFTVPCAISDFFPVRVCAPHISNGARMVRDLEENLQSDANCAAKRRCSAETRCHLYGASPKISQGLPTENTIRAAI